MDKKKSHRGEIFKKGQRHTFPDFTLVSSALRGLTILFGMGRSDHPRHSRPKIIRTMTKIGNKNKELLKMVSLRVISTTRLGHYCLYTCSLST